MPHDLRNGQWLEPTTALVASNHVEYTAEIHLWTERLKVNPKRATRTSNLAQDPVGFEVGSPDAEPTFSRRRKAWVLRQCCNTHFWASSA
jgi:hypothetical protein